MFKLSEKEINKRLVKLRNIERTHLAVVKRNGELEEKIRKLKKENKEVKNLKKEIENLKLQIEELRKMIFKPKKKPKDQDNQFLEKKPKIRNEKAIHFDE